MKPLREFYGYFDSQTGDERTYDASEFAEILRACAQSGVAQGLQVSAEGTEMKTVVSPGACVVGGYVYTLSDDGGSPMTLTHETSGAAPRIDRVVVRLDLSARTIGIRTVAGTPGATPAPPALTNTALVKEISLARVAVRAGTGSILAGDITDERWDESVCGAAVPPRLRKSAGYYTAAEIPFGSAGQSVQDALNEIITAAPTDAEIDAIM